VQRVIAKVFPQGNHNDKQAKHKFFRATVVSDSKVHATGRDVEEAKENLCKYHPDYFKGKELVFV